MSRGDCKQWNKGKHAYIAREDEFESYRKSRRDFWTRYNTTHKPKPKPLTKATAGNKGLGFLFE